MNTQPQMRQRTLDLITDGVAAFNSGDIDGMLAPMHPDVEFQPLRAVLEGTVYHGHEGFRRWLLDMADDWREFDLEVIDVSEVGPNCIIVQGRVHARGRASGVVLDATAAWLCELRDGLIGQLRFYTDVETARAAATPPLYRPTR
jgi:ketosteroid isomerase-like protein